MRWIELADAISNIAVMKLRVEAENIERVKANMESLIEVVNKGNRASVQTHQAMNTIGTEMRGRLREQNLLINSWRIMHPQLSLLTRGLSNVATVGHVLVNAFQAMSIMQLRQKQSARDMADVTQELNNTVVEHQKNLKNYGVDDYRTVESGQKVNELKSKFDSLAEATKAEKWQDTGQKIAVALSLVGVGANIFNTVAAFKALKVSIVAAGVAAVGTGGAGGLVAISKLVSAAFASMWVKALAPVAVVLGLDYVIAKMRNIPSVLEIAAAQFPAADFTDMLPTVESSKKAQELINKRIAGEAGASLIAMSQLPSTTTPTPPPTQQNQQNPDWLDWLKNQLIIFFSGHLTTPLVGAEIGGGISNVTGMPFGPAQPTARENYIAGGGNYNKATQTVTNTIIKFSQTITNQIPTMEDMGDMVSRFTDDDLAHFKDTFAITDQTTRVLNDAIGLFTNDELAKVKERYGQNAELISVLGEEYVVNKDQLNRLTKLYPNTHDKIVELGAKYKDGAISQAELNAELDKVKITAEAFRRYTESIFITRKGRFESPFTNVGAALSGVGAQTGGGGTTTGGGAGAGSVINPTFGKYGPFEIWSVSGKGSDFIGRFVSSLGTQYIVTLAGDIGEKQWEQIFKGGNINSDYAQNYIRAFFQSQFPTVGFAKGGIINEPIIGAGMHSGRSYMFGENGPETVIQGRGVGGGITVYAPINIQGSLIKESELITKVSEAIARRVQGLV